MENLPIFICGFERSGTTLLRRLVSMHPALKYELLHEQRKLLNYKTANDAMEKYKLKAKQGGKLTGSIASIESGEKIPYRDNWLFIIEYIERWKRWWPDSIIMHVDRDIEMSAKSAVRTFNRDYDRTIEIAMNNIPKIKKYLERQSNVIWISYEKILANPHHFVKNLYSIMGDFNEDDNYIHKVTATKDPWEYKGRVNCGLRYADGIRSLHKYD